MQLTESTAKRRVYDDPIRGSLWVLAASVALVFAIHQPDARTGLVESVFSLAPILAFLVTFSLGCFLGYRIVGLIPPAITIIAIVLLGNQWLGVSGWRMMLVVVAGAIAVASALAYLWSSWLWEIRHGSRPAAVPTRNFWLGMGLLGMVAAITVALRSQWIAWSPDTAAVALLILVVLMAGYAWHQLFRIFFEMGVELLIRVLYRLRFRGPGIGSLPRHGPVIIIANHACWWDPLFLAGGIPRPVTPMMTSAFYDIWFLRPLMVYVFHVIRVRDVAVRKETPEIDEAIAVLDAGECLVIFPEGYLRRKDEQPLRRFGRGIWEILRARPETPVVACWIEGGWGSWTSYFNGPPLQNKKPDLFRAITVSVSNPCVVPAEILKNHLKTRLHLMNEVAAARKHQGLSELPSYEMPANGSEPTL